MIDAAYFPRALGLWAAIAVTLLSAVTSVAGGLGFSIVALPDTQKYLDSSYTYDPVNPGTTPVLPTFSGNFAAQTSWIAGQVDARRIAFVSHLGDIVEHGGGSEGVQTGGIPELTWVLSPRSQSRGVASR
jgi:hypothetical protein